MKENWIYSDWEDCWINMDHIVYIKNRAAVTGEEDGPSTIVLHNGSTLEADTDTIARITGDDEIDKYRHSMFGKAPPEEETKG